MANLARGIHPVDSAVSGIGRSNAVYNRAGVNLQGPRDVDWEVAARQALKCSPWFQLGASMHGLAPVFLQSTPRTTASMFGLGIATSKGLIQDVPFETLAMVAGQIVFARALGLREVYALLATELAFTSGSVAPTQQNYDDHEKLEGHLNTIMANVSDCITSGRHPNSEHFGSEAGDGVRFRWLVDRTTLLKDDAVRQRAESILASMFPVEGESAVFGNYLAHQNAYVEAMEAPL